MRAYVPKPQRTHGGLSDAELSEKARRATAEVAVVSIALGATTLAVSFAFPGGPICGLIALVASIVVVPFLPNEYNAEISVRENLDPLFLEYNYRRNRYRSTVKCPRCGNGVRFQGTSPPFLGRCCHCQSLMKVVQGRMREHFNWTGPRGGVHNEVIDYDGLRGTPRVRVMPGEIVVEGHRAG